MSIILHTTATSPYDYYNLKDCTADTTLSAGSKEVYDGVINTGGNWVKVTLDILNPAKIDSTAGNELISFKVGSGDTYNLWIDDITVENE